METDSERSAGSKEMSTIKDGPEEQTEIPEEGLKAWLCVLGGFFCQFCSFGFLNALVILQRALIGNYLTLSQMRYFSIILRGRDAIQLRPINYIVDYNDPDFSHVLPRINQWRSS